MQDNHSNAVQRIKAVVAPYNPLGSTRNVNFTTGVRNRSPVAGQFYRVIIDTNPEKSHVNRAVCDNNWEATFCRIIDTHPKVISYVKNHGLGLEVPYLMGSTPHTYVPDFVVRVDDGKGPEDLLNLIAEVKGYRGEDAIAKANTMASYWVPGVNNLGCYGRWAFHEFKSSRPHTDRIRNSHQKRQRSRPAGHADQQPRRRRPRWRAGIISTELNRQGKPPCHAHAAVLPNPKKSSPSPTRTTLGATTLPPRWNQCWTTPNAIPSGSPTSDAIGIWIHNWSGVARTSRILETSLSQRHRCSPRKRCTPKR